MREYRTDQRTALTDFFKKNCDRQFTIDGILSEMPGISKISRSAVYRNVDRMVQDGILCKSIATGSRRALYQFIHEGECCERLHLRCEKCGRLFHMESEGEEEKLKNMLEKSGFQLDERSTVLVGTCRECKKRPEEF